VREGRDKLPGPSNTALIHRTEMTAKYICGIVTGACCFSAHRVLRPSSAHSDAGHGYMLVTGSSWAPARLEMHLQPSVQSASHADCGLSGLCARTASELASDPGLRGKHASRHARAAGSEGLQALPSTCSSAMWMCERLHIIAGPLSTHQRVPLSRHIVAADAPDQRMQPGPGISLRLFQPS
jgi:hypothetical protein